MREEEEEDATPTSTSTTPAVCKLYGMLMNVAKLFSG